jgi:hypothetical protein
MNRLLSFIKSGRGTRIRIGDLTAALKELGYDNLLISVNLSRDREGVRRFQRPTVTRNVHGASFFADQKEPVQRPTAARKGSGVAFFADEDDLDDYSVLNRYRELDGPACSYDMGCVSDADRH